MLRRIVFGFCLILLLTGNIHAQEKESATVDVLAKTITSWDNNALPHYPEGTPEITILRIQIPPKVQLPFHAHPVINAGVLLAGELTVVSKDNEILHLKVGDAIVEVVNKWHYGVNEGT